MKTMIRSQTSRNLQTLLPFASPLAALAAMLLIAAASGIAVMMG